MAGPVTRLGCISRATRRHYISELKEVLAHCLRHDVTHPLRLFLRRWIAKGAPVDPAVLYVPRASLRILIRQIAAAFPTLGAFHADARLWLREPETRAFDPVAGVRRRITGPALYAKPYAETFLPFNVALYAPRDTPYHAFNEIGFLGEYE